MLFDFFIYYLSVTFTVYFLVFFIEYFIPEETKFKKWWRKNVVTNDYDNNFE